MKINKAVSTILLALLCACLFLTGCSAAMPKTADMAAPAERPPSAEIGFNGEADAPVDALPENNLPVGRKLIRNAELNVQTLEFDRFLSSLYSKLNALGGYIEANSVDGRGGGMRYANMVLRVPAEKLDEFLAEVDGLGNVTRREEALADVTDQYTDTEAMLASLRTEYETLLGLLSKAEKLEDIITLQDRLSDVRYRMESLEARLRSYDSQIAYSRVSLYVNEVRRETAVEQETFGDEVSRRFNESLQDVGDAFTSFAKWFIGNLPHIVVTLIFIALPVIVLILIVRGVKRKRARLAAQYAVQAEKQADAARETVAESTPAANPKKDE